MSEEVTLTMPWSMEQGPSFPDEENDALIEAKAKSTQVVEQ